MKMTYTTTILKDDEMNATGIPVPAEVQGTQRWSLALSAAPADTTQARYTEGTFMANRPFSTLIQTYESSFSRRFSNKFQTF